MNKVSIENFKKGMSIELTRLFTDEDVRLFANVSGDNNPIHLDEKYAASTMFGKRIVHGALASSVFSSIFANTLPGPGCIYVKSEVVFKAPIYLNETIAFRVEISEVDTNRNRVLLNCEASSSDRLCIVSKAELYIPS